MVKMVDLQKQYYRIKELTYKRIAGVLEHGRYIMGPEISELEKRLADYVGIKYAVTCSSGTDALLMALMAFGIGEGDAVLTTPFTFISTSEVISFLGATPVFVDIDPNTYNINPDLLEDAVIRINSEGKLRAKAVMPVDLFGLPAEYEHIGDIASRYGLKVIEDAAQSFGGVYKNQKTCSFGDAAATSFFPSKPLGCYGDGGAIFTNDEEVNSMLVSIRVHGKGRDKYENVRIGLNGRLDTIQAAVLLAKLSIFDDEIKARNEIARKYSEGLKGAVKTPEVPLGYYSAWAQYSVLAGCEQERDAFLRGLAEKNVQTAVYYRRPIHLQPVYAGLNYRRGDCPTAEDISRRIFSLPMHPYLTSDEVSTVIDAMCKI